MGARCGADLRQRLLPDAGQPAQRSLRSARRVASHTTRAAKRASLVATVEQQRLRPRGRGLQHMQPHAGREYAYCPRRRLSCTFSNFEGRRSDPLSVATACCGCNSVSRRQLPTHVEGDQHRVTSAAARGLVAQRPLRVPTPLQPWLRWITQQMLHSCCTETRVPQYMLRVRKSRDAGLPSASDTVRWLTRSIIAYYE